jgi:D-alanyl-D-alanine carboxypeptidase
MGHPLLRAVVAQRRHDYNQPPLWAFRNINRFLLTYPGADGIKTGYEIRAGRCLAASATRNGRRVIAVVLNSEDYVADSIALIDYGFARLGQEERRPAEPGAAWPQGVIGRLMSAATERAVIPVSERPYLRSVLRADRASFDRDPTLVVSPRSAFERLREANGPGPSGG